MQKRNLNCSNQLGSFANNVLSNLDVSTHTALTALYCEFNQLTNLNVKNGNNMNMWNFNMNMWNFGAFGNPNLSCIEVDSAAWSSANWSNNIDPTAYFSENCNGVGILDNNESNAPNIYPNPTTGPIFLSENGDVALSDLSGKLLLKQKNTNQMDISALPTGIYFLSFGENKQHTFKVVKE